MLPLLRFRFQAFVEEFSVSWTVILFFGMNDSTVPIYLEENACGAAVAASVLAIIHRRPG
jgi:hypothetical protein